MLKMAQQLLHKVLVSFLPLFSPRKERIYFWELLVGVCRAFLQILTL